MRIREFEDTQSPEPSTATNLGPRSFYGMDVSQDFGGWRKEGEERGTMSIPAGRTIIGLRGSFPRF